ncbi:hypothetical protein KIN20_013399 [Parelaphostrongylus tenuis]|uniref:Uncharacterized protein n=1 Tax=Parelaphostrongylus tenuis TaxID=148309 RepID=A0AAD5QMJ9_PARTN|nr:hypothetical protein KIN20_013399 [Parelaphostrongylus tenuis]
MKTDLKMIFVRERRHLREALRSMLNLKKTTADEKGDFFASHSDHTRKLDFI